MAKVPMRTSGRPEYREAAERFLLLVGAARMSKARLSRLSGVKTVTLTSYERAQRTPTDAFRPRSQITVIARAMNMLPSALIAWWATGDDGLLSVNLKSEMDRFSACPLKERMEIWQDLGWQLPQGGQPGKKAAPPATD